MKNDNYFIQAFLSNDNRVIKEYYKETFPMMKSFINSNFPMLRDEEVKDIFQESLIALWTNIKEGKYSKNENVKLTSYTLQIAKFKILDKLKKKSYQMETQIHPGVDKEEENELFIEEDPQVVLLRKLVQKMPERCKKMLTAYYYDEKKLSEIASSLGIGQSSIKNEKYRCMKKLKELFKAQ